MSLDIELLGPPTVRRDGRDTPRPRGHKAWALLAYLLLSPRPASRERLATLLFDEASDPLGALRWNLAELRRSLGPDVAIGGEPVAIRLPEASRVDTEILGHGDPALALEVAGLGHDLLEGIDLPAEPAFETWLLAERRRFAGISAAILREAAITALAAGRAEDAIGLASRLVAIEDFDEESHALLVRAYVAAGDLERARTQSARSAAYLRDELGIEPSATLARALDDAVLGRPGSRLGDPRSERAIVALIEAGRAAFNAGAADAGVQTLKRAVDESEAAGEERLRARALLALGVALVHLGRGRDGEGATVLHAALEAAGRADDAQIRAEASRELGYIEFLRGRYDRAESWLKRAMAEAPDVTERATALGVLGAVVSDRGRTFEALGILARAAAVGRDSGRPRVEGWARAFAGRAHLLRGEFDEATAELDRAIEICRAAGWLSFAPYPQALRADVHLVRGELDRARDLFEAAFAVGCQIGDPCWEGLGARGIGLSHLAAGEVAKGFEWLADAAVRCVRIPDAYLWIEAYCLDALARHGIEHGRPEAAGWIERLESLAARTGMREMLARSALHRAALGDPSALEAARSFCSEIDDPTVVGALESAVGVGSP